MKKPEIEDISNTELCKIIDEWINGRHAERNREIMKRRLIDGICLEPLAEEFDLSVRHIKEIVYKCEHIIFRHI